LTLTPGDPASVPTRIALELGTPVFDQEALSMTNPVSLPAWATGHPAALSWAQPDMPSKGHWTWAPCRWP
jgi:hypothetical protein